MPGALREDALRVIIARDGRIYFRNSEVAQGDLTEVVREELQHGAEKRVYVAADSRTGYGEIGRVVDEIRLAGVEKISFLTE